MAQAILFAGLLTLSFLLTSCKLPVFATPGPTATPTLTSTPTVPPPTPTLTPTPTPIPTPTPVPAMRIESGDRALFDGDYDTALQEYIAAGQTSQDPDIQTASLLGMGRVYYLKGDYPRALEALRALVKDYPTSAHMPAAYFSLGQVYDALSRYAEAADAYQNYLMHRPGLIDAYLYELRGDALINAGNYSGALIDYQASLASPRAGDTTPLQIKMAHTYAITGDFATAIVMYNDIFNRATDDYTKAQVDLLLGQAYTAIGQTENANKTYLDAVENYPLAYDSYLALVNLVDSGYPVNELERGLVDYYADQYPVALAAFNRYLEAGPTDASTARYYKGLTLSAMEDYSGAIDQWDIVIKRFPEAGVWDNAWEMKAYTQWYYLDKYPEAAQTLLDFVASSPAHARAAEFLFDAARVYERSGKLAKAAKTWERVTDEYPASEYAFRSLFLAGISLYRQPDYVAANADFQRLLGMSDSISEKSTAYFWIGKTLNAQGDTQGARLNWEQAATTDPTGYYSERARDILSNRQPFSPSPNYDLTFDRITERKEAEAWLRTKFSLPADTNLSDPGPLLGDSRLARGAELWQLGLYSQARDEFENLRLSVENDPANTFRLANYFLDLGLYRSSILAARQVLTLAGMDDAATLNPDVPLYFNHIRFGTYYSNLIIPVAQAYNFPPLFLFSLIRQESFFESFVISPAGARGLMQIMPATAQGIADQSSWPPNFIQDDLFRPKVSITFGVDYLAHQRDYLGGDLYAALAAYNGGPGNANEWQGLSGGDPDVLLEIVRFDETHRYITGIYEMFNIYRRIYDRTP